MNFMFPAYCINDFLLNLFLLKSNKMISISRILGFDKQIHSIHFTQAFHFL